MLDRMILRCRCWCIVALFLAPLGWAHAQTKLLRYPDVHGDRIVFVYAGDLWQVASSGGSAWRLTAHPGLERFPKFSPDGRSIAFTGQYDGDEQVYVIPATGGVPEQLTYYPARGPLPPRWGSDNQVHGWSPEGQVLFRSMRDGWDLSDTRLYTVPLTRQLPVPLPMPVSGAGAFSPDGTKVVYSPLIRDFRTWKRYEGGWAQDLYIFDLETLEARQITEHPRSERDPMWFGDKIYFSADWDGTLNLYSFDVASGETQQLTDSTIWDVRWPSSDETGQIVYELNGELHVFDTGSGRSKSLSITVPNDGLALRPSRVSASDLVEDFELSPKGERALFVARGDVFTVPIEKGASRNLTRSSSAHDKWARWSPDGSKIAFVSDLDGEEEIYLVDQSGAGDPERLTQGGRAMRYAPEWAPDGKRLAFSDKDGKLYVLRLADRSLKEIADETRGMVRDYAWSPNGGHLAFTLSEPSQFRSIYVWSAEDGRVRKVTGEYFHEFSPAWHPEGKYLYYLGDREFAPQIGSFEFNYVVDRETAIFALALRSDVPHPFPPESDEVTIGAGEEKQDEDESAEGGGKAKKGKEESKPTKAYIKIDFDGLAERVIRVPVPADNYEVLAVTTDHLLYVRTGPRYYGRQSHRKPELAIFSIEDREETVLAAEISGFAVSRDGSKILVQHDSTYKLYDASPGGNDSPTTVSTAGLRLDVVPKDEWAQIFNEVWRRYRDFFYVDNMHGYDWESLRDRYRPLLEHVAHRSDLNYLLGEMIAELNVSHTYVSGGDFEIPDRPQVALPGARFGLDRKAGRYRVAAIYLGQNKEDRYRAPLTEVGIGVSVGDYLLVVNGEELLGDDNPYRLLRHKADGPVQFTVNDRPTLEGARQITFEPITSEHALHYLAWVNRNRAWVSEETDGRVGYLHIPDMSSDGIREFIKWFYPQIRKEGLIIDVRTNGGGNVSQMLIERLRRELLGVDFVRTYDHPTTYPAWVFHGHLVCVLDEDSASDGDVFPYMFRAAGLGPLIGKRSWGGVIGITGRGPLIDGGTVAVPEFGQAGADGRWIIEGYGVEPDIVVENDPKSVIEGRDPQLERAVEEILRRIEADPRSLPSRPPPPVKTAGPAKASGG